MRRRGFALPLVMGIMVVIFMIGAAALRVAMVDFRASRSTHLSSRALFAAEAGADLTLAGLVSNGPGTLMPGDSVSTGWRTLSGRGMYESTTLRVDDGVSGNLAVRILTEGRSDGRRAARRRVVLVAMCRQELDTLAGVPSADLPSVHSCSVSTLPVTGGDPVPALSELARFRGK